MAFRLFIVMICLKNDNTLNKWLFFCITSVIFLRIYRIFFEKSTCIEKGRKAAPSSDVLEKIIRYAKYFC